MGIDWLPTIASFTGSELPKKKIDGASLVPLLTGENNISPHKNFFFYYRTNELHAVRHKNWKLYLPHTYRSLNGRKGRNDGYPVPYDMNEIKIPKNDTLSMLDGKLILETGDEFRISAAENSTIEFTLNILETAKQ